MLSLVLTNCTTTLAPAYDAAIVNKTSTASTNVMLLFATTIDGTTKDNYILREPLYNNAIATFEALNIQAQARPIPDSKISKKVNEILGEKGLAQTNTKYPSATAFLKISETLVKMKSTDKKQGLTATEVLLFKDRVKIFLDQALTYERFLKR